MANTLRFKRGLVSGIPTAALGEPLFTTDTFDLYIGNGTTNTRFQKYIASGTTSQLLRGDGSLLTMPIVLSSPANGEVLKYNGTNWVNSADAGVTGSGTAGQVTYWGSSSTITGNAGLVFNGTNRLTIDGGTTGYLVGPTGEMLIGEDAGGVYIGYGFGVSPAIPINYGSTGTTSHIWRANGSERMRLHSTGNLVLGGTVSTDNGLRFQVTGDGYFSGSVGIGTTSITDVNLYIRKNLSGSVFPSGVYIDSTIQSTSTTGAAYISTSVSTQAATFTLPNLYHFRATQSTIGAGSTVTNQYGYIAESSLIGATNNFGFYGNIASGTGRWNLYMNGSAANFLNGNLGVGTNSISARLHVSSTSSGDGIRVSNTGTATIRLFNNSQTTGSFELGQGFASGTDNVAYVWNGSNASMVFGTNATERMRLDASGNLGLGVTPSAWGSSYKAMQINSQSSFSGFNGNFTYVGTNLYIDGSDVGRYITTGATTLYRQSNGAHAWFYSASGTAGNAITFTQAMTLFATGNLAVGTTTDAGFRLDVNGTMRVSGASTLSGAVSSNVVFRTNHTGTGNEMTYIGERGGGVNGGYIQLRNTNIVTVGIDSNGASFFNGGNVAFDTNTLFVDATNNRVGIGTASPSVSLDVVGAATFSSSVTAGGNLLLTAGTASSIGAINLIRTGTSPVASRLTFGTDGTGYSFAIGKNQAGSVTDLVTILDTGAATFSSSVTCASLVVDSTTLVVDATNNRVGVGTNAPTSSLHVVGSVTKSHTTKTANYTMTESDYTVLCDTTSGGFTISLPAASGCSGRIYVIKKITGNSGTNNITIDPNGSETIDGATTYALQCRSSVIIQSDGSNWWILAERVDNSCI